MNAVRPVSTGAVGTSGAPGSRELRVFIICCAIIILHALVNAFVALEPGAARSDHLLAALVPVAAAGLAAVLYRRLRAGLCASVLAGHRHRRSDQG